MTLPIRIETRGHLVHVRIDTTDDDGVPIGHAVLNDREALDLMALISRAHHAARTARKSLTGATEWRAQLTIGGDTAVVNHDDQRSLFGRHVAKASRFKRTCVGCREAIEEGSVYWSEKPAREQHLRRTHWGGRKLCDACVRPEVRAAALLEPG